VVVWSWSGGGLVVGGLWSGRGWVVGGSWLGGQERRNILNFVKIKTLKEF